MLALFPSLLSYQFFAIAILRVAAALAILWIAYFLFAEREAASHKRFPLITHLPQWVFVVYAGISLLTGGLLLVGLYTQAAAIAGMVISLDHGLFAKRYPDVVAVSVGTAALIFVICFTLLFLGAGKFAIDWPL